SYGEKRLLHQFDMQVEEGEFVSLIGPSGVGKSTLFQLASGLLRPDAGTIALDGIVETNLLGKVAYMPQKDLLLPWRTVTENAALPLELQGVPKREAREQVIERLALFGLAGCADAYPDQLSGGMRQRVSFLRTILTGCDLMLLDEPFSALDGITRLEMQEWLLEMWQRLGSTVIMITHDIEEAMLLADRVIVLLDTPLSEPIEMAIPLERPRRPETRHDPGFQKLREQIWTMLRERTGDLAHHHGRYA
ncbi:ABC transporter ATP-binding protein, partial [Microbacteriaceae bacterium K1510]|nr:ABC transporter ATP-binding protein [Microbacteriaceae bacterium K1510]